MATGSYVGTAVNLRELVLLSAFLYSLDFQVNLFGRNL